MDPKLSRTRTALPTTIRVGHCELKPATGELIRDGAPVLLGRRALDLLIVLLQAEGELVTNEDILRQVWDGVVVELNTVQAHVSSLRRALRGDRGLLKTYSGRGYRLLKIDTDNAAAESPGAKAPAAPLAQVLAAPHALPSASSELIGRDRLLAQIRPLLIQHRLVTLTGAGGIGKTRLALETSRSLVNEFAGGVFLFDLAPIGDAQFVSSALISSIGPSPSFHLSLEERARALGSAPTLIVLDNCEHLVEAVAEAVEVMLRSNAAIRIFATSREPLRASGEVVFKVPPLEVPARDEVAGERLLRLGAVQLFLSRSPALYERFVSAPAVAADVARICRNLDGIPLAIELAAARADSLGVETVAARLGDGLDLLKGGARTALPRHQTLRATLEWSYELLSETERAVFSALAVFAAGFTIEAACHVLASSSLEEERVLGHIADLVDKSLISVEVGYAGSRYRFLETTRAFAFEKLSSSGQLDRLARRHAEFRLQALAALDPDAEAPSVHSNVALFRSELENIRALLDWAYSESGDAALGFALTARAVPLMLDAILVEEVLIHAARAMDKTPQELIVDKVQDLRIRTAMTTFRVYMQGSDERATSEWSEVLHRAQQLGNQAFEIRALWGLWTVSTFAGYPRRALRFAEQFVERARQAQNESAVVLGDRLSGVAQHYLGEQRDARRHLEAIISRYVYTAHPTMLGGTMDHRTAARATLARVLWFQGFVDRAIEQMEMCVTEAIVQDHPTTICFVLIECAIPLSLLVADVGAARKYLALLSSALRLQGFVIFEAVADCYAALLSNPSPGGAGSVELLSSIERLRRIRFDVYSTELRLRVAAALREQRQATEALALIDETLARTVETEERLWEPELVRTRAELLMTSDARTALRDIEGELRDALRLANLQGALSMELRVGMTLARVLARLDREQEGVALLGAIYGRFVEGHDTFDLEEARQMLQLKPNQAASDESDD